MKRFLIATAVCVIALSCISMGCNRNALPASSAVPIAVRAVSQEKANSSDEKLYSVQKSNQTPVVSEGKSFKAVDVWKIEFSPDGQRFLTLNPHWDNRDIDIPKYVSGKVQLWNRAGKLLQTIQTGSEELHDAVFLRDNKTLVTIHPRRMKFWDAQTGRFKRVLPTQSKLVAFTSDRSLAATARADYLPTKSKGVNNGLVRLQIFDMSKATLQSQSHVIVPPADAGFSDDMPLGFFNHNRQIRALPLGYSSWMEWETTNAKYLSLKKDELWNRKVPQVISHDGTVALSVDYQAIGPHFQPRALTLRDSTTWRQIKDLVTAELENHYQDVAAAAFSPDDKLLAAIVDQSLWFFDTKDWHIIKKQKLPNSAVVLAFSPDGKTLVTGGERKITLWRVN